MAQEIEVKPAAWKRMAGGLFMIIAFIFGAMVVALIQQFVILGAIPGMIVMAIPWLFGWLAYRLVKRWTAKG